ncbi:3-oxoacyl-[acyl-carrier-protein] synthase III C-terminal domain-containing protein [Kutzneria kofuensis]|uniref:3-oxoacyl-[acyl-carrier-protein] synthase-3 n=1 Tax=Kutzneria kofuensis TaxID=103725 RepID=A0A7W9KSE1_9PSEU|nr:3-oxoacyl-[acyl-carrier-protein] synthase III C-terminal domain-containing protein [Kutzneria kofuensis]MBB5897884.1 3-oxoacyl-[acyl-carrier-protein] synthase-3 [Kutzneria kofuensis]
MPRPFALRAVAHFLPDDELLVADLPFADEERETGRNLGIERVRADDGLSAVDLAVRAGEQALTQAGLNAGDLDALIVIDSRVPRTLLSSEATRVQAILGARRAVTFGVGGLGCVSIAPALRASRAFLADEETAEHVLVVHGSKPATPNRYRHPVTVNGDGGQAVVIGRTGPLRVLDLVQYSNGEYWDLFAVDFRDRPVADWREECADPPKYSFKLAVETRNRLRELYRDLLARNGMVSGDVHCHLGQNLSEGSLRFTAESLDVQIAKACTDNLRRYGHLGPNDMLLNLTAAIDGGELGAGQRAVLVGASPVAAWSLLLVENGDSGATEHYL